MNLLNKIKELRDLAIREHYEDKSEGLHNCSKLDNINLDCDCGAEKHNQRVDLIWEQLSKRSWKEGLSVFDQIRKEL